MKTDTDFLESCYKNNLSAFGYFMQLGQIAISRFQYKNLPESIDPIFMEKKLLFSGKICVFEDDVLGMLALPLAGGGTIDQYNIPTNRHIVSSGYEANRTIENSVIIYDNVWRVPTAQILMQFAERLAECDRTIDVNIKAQKTPVLIQCEDKERLSLMQAYQKYDGNQPFIFAGKQFNLDSFKVLKTDAPYLADKLQETKINIWNQALTWLGIPNVSSQKRERLVTDEVTRGMGGTIANRFGVVDCRKKGFDMVNQMFGTNIEISFQNVDTEQNIKEGEYNE